MTRHLNTALTVAFAFALTFGSIGAIVVVPPVQAEGPAVLALPEIA